MKRARTSPCSKLLFILIATCAMSASTVFATNGTWIGNNAGTQNWSNPANWNGGAIADGVGATADFSMLDITGNTDVTLDSARTAGVVNIGDTNGSDVYFFSAAAGISLTLDNGASHAQINHTSTSSVTPFNIPLILNSSLDVTNSSAGQTLGLQGDISSGTAGTKTITVSGGPVEMLGATTDGSGAVAVVYNGPGSLLLSNSSDNNAYSGGTTINGGQVSIGSSGTPFGTGTLTLAGGSIKTAGIRIAALPNNIVMTADTLFTGRTGSPGPSTVQMLFGGTLTGTGGTLTIQSDATSTSGLFEVRFSGGDYTMSRPIVLDNGAGAGAVRLTDVNPSGTTHTYSGVISGTGSFRRTAITTAGATIFLANNTYTGATLVGTGTLQLGNGGTTGSLSPSSTITLVGSAGVLSFDHTSGSDFVQGTNFSSAGITGIGSIVKEGTSGLTFNVANTFSGGLTINNGTVNALADGAIGAGNVSLTATSVSLTLQGGATNNYVSDSASLSFVSGDTVNLNYVGTDIVGALIVNGVSQAPGVYSSVNFSEFMGTGTITVIPEPRTVAMLLLGAGLVVGKGRRKN